MKSAKFDALDRQLVQALQLDGRLPFSRIAEVLGVSDQTVARRYTRLRTAGRIRVLATTDAAMLGEVQWLIRVQCKPDGAQRLGQMLSLRDDTTWVSLTSGGTEISCMTSVPEGRQSQSLLLTRLPRTPSVVSMTAHCVMHTFYGGSRGLSLKSDALTEEQAAALQPEPPRPYGTGHGGEPVTLDDGDRRMLAVLGKDGRADLAELATATGWSQSTVRRRLAQLRSSGTVYLDLEYDHSIFDLSARVLLWLSVAPAELEATGQALAEHPEVAYACATTGATNLHAVALCKDIHSVYSYLTTRVATLAAVHQVETSPIMQSLKGAASLRTLPPQ
ncbi:Lrp/AsnC family transcriptional regulator [Actinospica durhamensis]|uniref:Lrp/AsnC family transcriptional regulator n=1 Tax=Actinospica durhamensis TaxID=1508375 RepID=A0A941F087_9ACTN|nr:AsnC family transcriptional regulator [Actinospica durhamensis]MBR7838914.1 Lrp/AsnC family transcriptional regulator [Actinospica durhamensis]